VIVIAIPTNLKWQILEYLQALIQLPLDKACYDAVKNSKDEGRFDLIERMDSRHAIHIVEQANAENLGNTDQYEIINIDI
jgi:uncharacterized Fe-S center protein